MGVCELIFETYFLKEPRLASLMVLRAWARALLKATKSSGDFVTVNFLNAVFFALMAF